MAFFRRRRSLLVYLVVITVIMTVYFNRVLFDSSHKRAAAIQAQIIREFEEFPGMDSEQSSSGSKFIVFDAANHRGGLESLNNVPGDWEVFVVNLRNKRVMTTTCPRCREVENSWVITNLLPKIPEEDRRHFDYSTIAKMSTYLYLLMKVCFLFIIIKVILPKFHTFLSYGRN